MKIQKSMIINETFSNEDLNKFLRNGWRVVHCVSSLNFVLVIIELLEED